MKRELIALVAHNINQAYCAAIGDPVLVWDEAPDAHKASILAGVDMHLANPDTTPEAAHAAWLEQKTAEGWTFGAVKDLEAKTHPCLLPYAELPAEQKIKDHLFRAVVHSLKGIPDAAPAAPERLLLPVRYIGKRATYKDGAFGTYIEFEQGQSRMVPADIARKMVRLHPDVYEPGTADGADAPEVRKTDTEEESLQDLRDSVLSMNKAALQKFAKTQFGRDIDKNQPLTALRLQVTGLIDQFGAV